MRSARHMAKPTTVHMTGVKIILRYLRGTPDLPVIYKRDSSSDLVGYCDASYGLGDPDKIRSATGSMFFTPGGLVHFSSQLQKIVSRCTPESEIKTINIKTCAKQGVYLSGLLGELGWKHFRTFKISSDNRGALHLAADGNYSNRSKHIAIRYAALRDWITEKMIIIDVVSSKDRISDVLTKFCEKLTFSSLCTKVREQGSQPSS